MRKFLKYLLIFVLSCLIVFVLFSCRGKKAAGGVSPVPAAVPPVTDGLNEIRFGTYYVDGCSERMKGNLQEALKLFDKCAEIDPDNVPVKYELGTIHKLLGNNEKALQYARTAASADPRNEWYQLLFIDCLNALKQYPEAVKVREALVKNFPARSEFKEDLAIDYAMMGQYDRSFRIYDELEKTYGINEQLTLNKVKLLKSQKKSREIEQELLRLSASDERESRYYAYLAEYYLEKNDLESAKKMYDLILQYDPANPTVHLALHDYYTAKGDETTAFSHLKLAFLNPDLEIGMKADILSTFYNRAEAQPRVKEKGFELAAIMLKVHPKTPEANGMYADFLMLDKKLKEASAYYYAAAINERKDFRVWDNLLYTDNELQLYDSLQIHSAIAIELFPSQPRNYLYNGLASMQLRDYRKAALVLGDGLEYVVDNKALMLDFLRLLGDAHHYLGDHEKSDRAFEDALRIDADNAYVLNNYAYYLSLRGDYLDKAEKLSKRTIELHPGNRNYLDTYGWILYQQKKYDEAERWLSQASKMGPGNPTILEHYGDVLYRLGKTNEALIQWKAARDAGGSSAELLKKIREKKPND